MNRFDFHCDTIKAFMIKNNNIIDLYYTTLSSLRAAIAGLANNLLWTESRERKAHNGAHGA